MSWYARSGSAIDRSDVLGIAHCASDGRRANGDLRTGPFLPALTATLAHGHGDLELRAAGGLGRRGTIEHGMAERSNELVVGQVRSVLVIEHHASLA